MTPQEKQVYLSLEQPMSEAAWTVNDELPYAMGLAPSLAPLPPPAAPPAAGAIGVEKVCNGIVELVSWYVPSPGVAATARTVAAGVPASVLEGVVSATVAVPTLSIGISPAAGGITQLPAYFWLSGYRGTTLTGQGSDGGYTINVRATPVSYQWSFGDGASLTTSGPGVAYPAISPVSHTYTLRSDRSPQAVNGNYVVGVTVAFDTQYQLVGPGGDSAWVDFASRNLPGLSGTSSASYPVHEVIADLTAGSSG